MITDTCDAGPNRGDCSGGPGGDDDHIMYDMKFEGKLCLKKIPDQDSTSDY